jgi:hypothetical protein
MLRVRNEQFLALREPMVAEPRNKIIAALREKLPGETERFTPEKLNALCDYAITRAALYEIRIEFDVFVYAACMLLFGADFDVNPSTAWCQDILRDPRMDEEIKTTLLRFRITMDRRKEI